MTPTAATVRTALHYFPGKKDSWCGTKAVIREFKKSAKLFFQSQSLACRQSAACCPSVQSGGEASLG